MTRRIIRHAVPVDDAIHPITIPVGADAVLSVACRREDEIDFWVFDDGSTPVRTALFRVVGTGHPIAPNERWHGTCVAPNGFLVWHLMEVYSDVPELLGR